MHRRRQFLGVSLFCGALLALALSLTGCSDDLYASCELEPGSDCAEDENVSCVERQNLQCETQVCARFKGSEPFCTTTCEVDGDCVAGVCREVVFGDSTKYCVEETDV